MTVDTLEMQLRQQGHCEHGDVKTATIECTSSEGLAMNCLIGQNQLLMPKWKLC